MTWLLDLADRWRCPPWEILARFDSREITRLMAFDRMRPTTAEEIRHAELMHLLGIAHLKQPPRFADWLPARCRHAQAAQTPDEIKSRLGGLVTRKPPPGG